MGKIAVRTFTGEIPKSPPHLLPDSGAQTAVNCDLSHGDLRPLRTGKSFLPIGFPAKTIYSDDGNKFIGFPDIAQVYKSPVIEDTFNRFYYTDSQGLFVGTLNDVPLNTVRKVTDITRFRVGVPKPLSVTGIITADVDAITLIASYATTIKTKVKMPDGNPFPAPYITRQFQVARSVNDNKYTFMFDIVAAGEEETVTVLSNGQPVPRLVDVTHTFSLLFKTALGDIAVPYQPGSSQTITGFLGSFTVTQTLGEATELSTPYTVTVEVGVVETLSLAATQANIYGEESSPTVSSVINVRATDIFTVSVNVDSGTDTAPIKTLRIYKTSSTGSGFVEVRQVDISVPFSGGGETFSDGRYVFTLRVLDFLVESEQTFDVLRTADYLPPPSGLKNLVLMPNGFFAASKGNTVYFSEPYRPHTWQHSMTFPHDVTGLALGEQQLVVTTKANPYIVVGVSPETVTQQRLPDIQAGFSSRSMTNSNGLVVYLSRDGMVAVNGPTSSLMESQALFTREDWRNRYDPVLPVMQLTAYDGRLFGVNPTNENGFLLRLDEAAGNYTQLRLKADGVSIVPKTDSVYYSSNNTLFEFGAGDYMTAVWHSKNFILPRPSSFAAGFINSNGDVLVELFTDEGLFSSQTVKGKTFFRIKSGQPSRRWSVRLTTKAVVTEFVIAESMRDLQDG